MSQTKLDRIRELRAKYQESPTEEITININKLALDALKDIVKKSGLEHYTIDMAISDIVARDMINHM